MSEVPKFSLFVHEDTNEMCVLHREFPSCLVRLERFNPELFNIAKLYEDISIEEAINHPFIEDMKAFVQSELDKISK
ncbi:hypothetical protein ACFLRI_04165 [Bacteroidota bacterium]